MVSNSACAPYSQCTSYQYESIQPTPSSDLFCSNITTCLVRLLGLYLLYFLVLIISIKGNQYQLTPATYTSNRVCVSITTCGQGTYLSLNATATSDAVCLTCNAGYSDTDNSPQTPCTLCQSGEYVPPASSGPCTAFFCLPGTVDSDLNPATPCAACPLNQWQSAPGQTTCTVCAIVGTLRI